MGNLQKLKPQVVIQNWSSMITWYTHITFFETIYNFNCVGFLQSRIFYFFGSSWSEKAQLCPPPRKITQYFGGLFILGALGNGLSGLAKGLALALALGWFCKGQDRKELF